MNDANESCCLIGGLVLLNDLVAPACDDMARILHRGLRLILRHSHAIDGPLITKVGSPHTCMGSHLFINNTFCGQIQHPLSLLIHFTPLPHSFNLLDFIQIL